jgi:Predicted hydrolase of the metallo-beta-lactamase superfamily
VVAALSAENGTLISGPDLITRGFIYVKESESLMKELTELAAHSYEDAARKYRTDWAAIKTAVKGDMSNYLYKKTKRNPMVLPVILEV